MTPVIGAPTRLLQAAGLFMLAQQAILSGLILRHVVFNTQIAVKLIR